MAPQSTLAELLQTVRRPKRYQTEHRAQFEAYLQRALQQPASDGLGSQALYLFMEFDGRVSALTGLGRAFKWLALSIGIVFVLFSSLTKLASTPLRDIVGILLFFVFVVGCLILLNLSVVIAASSYFDYGRTQTALMTLEVVLGERYDCISYHPRLN